MEKELHYEGYTGTVNYDEKCDYYTGEVEIDGKFYTYEGDTFEELQEDFEDIIDSMLMFDELGDDEDDEYSFEEKCENEDDCADDGKGNIVKFPEGDR